MYAGCVAQLPRLYARWLPAAGRPPEMCGLLTRPRTDVDPPRSSRTAFGGGMSSRRPRGDNLYLGIITLNCARVGNYKNHRHRIDKYLDTLLANQPISDGEATDRCKSLRRKMAAEK